MGRGCKNSKTTEISVEKLGYDMENEEIRFIVYLLYCSVKGAKIDPEKVKIQEIVLMNEYYKRGWISFFDDIFILKEEIFMIFQNIVYWSYHKVEEKKCKHCENQGIYINSKGESVCDDCIEKYIDLVEGE